MKVYSIEINMTIRKGEPDRWEPWLSHPDGHTYVTLTHYESQDMAIAALNEIVGEDPADTAQMRVVEHVLLPGVVAYLCTPIRGSLP